MLSCKMLRVLIVFIDGGGWGVVGRDCGGVGGKGVGGKVVGGWAWARRAILGCEEEADGIGVVGRE